MKLVLKLSVVLLLLVVLVTPIAPGAHAAPQAVCVSNATGNWNTAGTWSCGGVPTASDIVIINDGYVVTLDTNGSASQLIVGGGVSGSLTHDGGSRTLTVGAGGVTVSSGASFTSPDSNLTVNGNLTNNGTLTASAGAVTFSGSSAQTIGGTGTFTFNNLTINNIAGVNLNKDIIVNGALALTSGDLNTGANILTLGGAVTSAGGGDVVGNVKRNGAFATATNYMFTNPNTLINFSTVTSDGTSSITVNLVKSAPGGLAQAIARTYSITTVNLSGINATLQLRYAQSEVAPLTEANLRPWKQISGRWTLQTGSVNTGSDFVSATGVSSFSPWAISDSGAPTAVTLSTLAANDPAQSNFVMPMLGLLGVVVAGGAWYARRARRS